MKDIKTAAELLHRQDQYIHILEEQLDVYEQKDQAQTLLIEQQNRMLELYEKEISSLKRELEAVEGKDR